MAMALSAFADALGRFRAAYPDVRVDDARLRARVAELWPDASEDDLRSVHLSDLFLTSACAQGNKAAIAAFERHFLQRLGGFPPHLVRGNDDVEEVRGRLRERLLVAEAGVQPKLAGF